MFCEFEKRRNWILKAESDLKVAKDQLNTEEPATDAICFHSEQKPRNISRLILSVISGKFHVLTILRVDFPVRRSQCNSRCWIPIYFLPLML